MSHEFKFAFRQVFKAPGFTLTAVFVLALGIGTNTAVFSLIHTLFFKPPAYSRPNELVQVFSQNKKNPKSYQMFSYAAFRDIREQNAVFTDTMAYNLSMIGLGKKGETRFGQTATHLVSAFSLQRTMHRLPKAVAAERWG